MDDDVHPPLESIYINEYNSLIFNVILASLSPTGHRNSFLIVKLIVTFYEGRFSCYISNFLARAFDDHKLYNAISCILLNIRSPGHASESSSGGAPLVYEFNHALSCFTV
jgi:hypothetical protein